MGQAGADWRLWTALGLVYVVWGSTYLAISFVVTSLPPLLTASARFVLASALLAAFLVVRRGRAAFRARPRELASAAAIGLLLLLGGNGGVTLAEHAELPSGLTALLIAGVPLWVVLLRAAGRDLPTPRTVLGVALGFGGLAVLLLPGARPDGVTLGPVLLVLGSSLLWALGSWAATRVPLPPDGVLVTVVEMLGGAVGLAVAGLARGESWRLVDVQPSSVLAFGYLVVFGSLVAFTAYSWLLGNAPVSLVATYAYVNPVVAVGLGVAFAGEAVPGTTVLGGVVTVAAVAVVVAEESRRRRATLLEVPADAPGSGVQDPAVRPDGQGPEDRQGRLRRSAT